MRANRLVKNLEKIAYASSFVPTMTGPDLTGSSGGGIPSGELPKESYNPLDDLARRAAVGDVSEETLIGLGASPDAARELYERLAGPEYMPSPGAAPTPPPGAGPTPPPGAGPTPAPGAGTTPPPGAGPIPPRRRGGASGKRYRERQREGHAERVYAWWNPGWYPGWFPGWYPGVNPWGYLAWLWHALGSMLPFYNYPYAYGPPPASQPFSYIYAQNPNGGFNYMIRIQGQEPIRGTAKNMDELMDTIMDVASNTMWGGQRGKRPPLYWRSPWQRIEEEPEESSEKEVA